MVKSWLGLFFGCLFGVVLAQEPGACSMKDGSDLGGLNWMAGHWRLEDQGKVSEEWWVPAAGGLMLGLHRDTTSGKRAFFEYLRIEHRGDAVVYLASPLGRDATEFTLSDCGSDWAVFENAAHDWPKVIRYQLEGNTLIAVAEGGKGEPPRATTWRLTRVETAQ